MTVLYVDLENGNDNYAGTSFDLLAQGTNGRISGSTFSSAGAYFIPDGSLIGQYLSIFNGSIYAVYRITATPTTDSLSLAVITGGTALANQTIDRQYYLGGRWKTLTSGATAARIAPGDFIRVMGSPLPTFLGQNATWTSQPLQATKNISSSTNATPISITINNHGYTTGDTLVVTGHTTNTNANGTWEITVTGANTFTLDGSTGNGTGGASGNVRLRNNTRVLLTTPVTETIASTGLRSTTWTSADAVNVTTAFNTNIFKEHNRSDSIAIAAGFATGRAAYWTLPSTLDLSGYQQVSFWISQSAGTIGAVGSIDLRLCSDALGTIAVNTITIPSLVGTARWLPVTVDLGVNLGSNINSVAFYVNTDNGAQTFLLNNIIACKASSLDDSLSLTSLIGIFTGYAPYPNEYEETFWTIQSINGIRVMLDGVPNQTPTSTLNRGYCGTGGNTYATAKRETIKLGATLTLNEGGTANSPITYSFGWDRVSMLGQILVEGGTWIDMQRAALDGVNAQSLDYINIEGLSVVRANTPVNITNMSYSSVSLGTVASCGAATVLSVGTPTAFSLNVGFICACNGVGLQTSLNCPSVKLRVTGAVVGNASDGMQLYGAPFVLETGFRGSGQLGSDVGPAQALIANNNGRGILARPNEGYIIGFAIFDNATTAEQLSVITGEHPRLYLHETSFSSVTPGISIAGTSEAIISAQAYNKTPGDHRVFFNGGLIRTDSTVTISGGISWKFQPTSATLTNSARPLYLLLGKIPFGSTSNPTVSTYMRRDNLGLNMRLVAKAYAIETVAFAQELTAATTNTWNLVSINLAGSVSGGASPGIVEVGVEVWGGSTFSGWIDGLFVST